MSRYLLVRIFLAGAGIMVMGIAILVAALQSRDRHEAWDLGILGVLLAIAGLAVIVMVVFLWRRPPRDKVRKELEGVAPPPSMRSPRK
jgi:uncharacterized membrane protein HdeD (DUF308 family)